MTAALPSPEPAPSCVSCHRSRVGLAWLPTIPGDETSVHAWLCLRCRERQGRQCGGKVRHDTEAEAVAERDRLEAAVYEDPRRRRPYRSYRVYRCDEWCGTWHVGTAFQRIEGGAPHPPPPDPPEKEPCCENRSQYAQGPS